MHHEFHIERLTAVMRREMIVGTIITSYYDTLSLTRRRNVTLPN